MGVSLAEYGGIEDVDIILIATLTGKEGHSLLIQDESYLMREDEHGEGALCCGSRCDGVCDGWIGWKAENR